MRFTWTLLLSLLLAATGCDDGTGPVRPDAGFDAGGGTDGGSPDEDGGTPPVEDAGPGCGALALTAAVSGLADPILVTAPEGDTRLFVVEIGGRVQIAEGGSVTGTFLDLSSAVTVAGDHGLNGLAFHPDYATNGRIYVTYATGRGVLRVASFTTGSEDSIDVATEETILEVTLPEAAHSGGHLAFGPDGYLYVGFGDGESSPSMMLAQDLSSLLGKVLRIDVDGGTPYAIPDGNPFTGSAAMRDEIFAYGLRLPYRFSFDGADLFVGEVGDHNYEQVELVTTGGDYGWPEVEGNMHCHTPATGCDTTSSLPPIFEFEHTGGRCAMMGGFVYRGDALPSCYQGRYFFSDYCTGQVMSFRVEGGAAVDVQDGPAAPGRVTSWGRDGAGELYLTGEDGNLYRLSEAP